MLKSSTILDIVNVDYAYCKYSRDLTSMASHHLLHRQLGPDPDNSPYPSLPSDPLHQAEQQEEDQDWHHGSHILQHDLRDLDLLVPFLLVRLLQAVQLAVVGIAFDPSSLLVAFVASSSFAAASSRFRQSCRHLPCWG